MQLVQAMQKPTTAAAISGNSVLISFFATTLPVVQWIAALLAIVVGGLAIVRALRDRGK